MTGDVVETMAGAKWKFATPIPLVPYLQGQRRAGVLLPERRRPTPRAWPSARPAAPTTSSSIGWASALEVGFSVGRIDYDGTFHGSHTYAVLDFGGGLEFQF